MTIRTSITVNGKETSREVEARTLLVHYLREELSLTGTHVGCDTSNCGACTVLLDGEAVKSCTVLAAQVHDCNITTIEGAAQADGSFSPVQEGFRQEHGLQCGYCTPGMVMNAVDICRHHPNPTEQQIREKLDGNICRCTGYQNIIKAVQQGAAAMKA